MKVSRHTAQAFLRLTLVGLPGCFSINEIYSYFITYFLSLCPGIRFSGPKENTSFWAMHSDVYVICFFNNLCDTHLQSFNSMELLMGAPAIAVKQLCRHLLSHPQRFSKLSRKETPARVRLYSHPPDVSSLSGRVMLRINKLLSTRIHLITRWPSLFPASYSRTSISVPYGFTCRIAPAKIRGFHVLHDCSL